MIYTDKDIEVAMSAVADCVYEHAETLEHFADQLVDYCVSYGASCLAYALGWETSKSLTLQRESIMHIYPDIDLPEMPGAEREEATQ